MDAESNGQWRGYGANKDLMPLGGYAALMGGYNLALAGFLIWAGGRRRRLIPERFRAGDLLLLGVATHKLTRLIGKDFVTSPLRAPFVEFKGSSIAGEVAEKSRGHGLRKAIGDLVTCEFCLAPWVAAALFCGYALDARATRFVASLFTAVSLSDFLNRAYTAAAKSAEAIGTQRGPSAGEGKRKSPEARA